MNLFKELTDCLAEHNLTLSDIRAVQRNDFGIDIQQFLEIAKRTEYDDGFGFQEIAEDLTIIGDGWILVRYEYDGAENFIFQDTRIKTNIRPIQSVKRFDADLNEDTEE